MPDWNALVRQRVKLPSLTREEQDEILAELPNHLEDLCTEHCAQGLSESAAIERALLEPFGKSLSENIQRARRREGTMNARTRQFWLPGLISSAIAIIFPVLLVWILIWLGFDPRRLDMHTMLKFASLLAGIVGGAAGAYLCRREGFAQVMYRIILQPGFALLLGALPFLISGSVERKRTVS